MAEQICHEWHFVIIYNQNIESHKSLPKPYIFTINVMFNPYYIFKIFKMKNKMHISQLFLNFHSHWCVLPHTNGKTSFLSGDQCGKPKTGLGMNLGLNTCALGRAEVWKQVVPTRWHKRLDIVLRIIAGQRASERTHSHGVLISFIVSKKKTSYLTSLRIIFSIITPFAKHFIAWKFGFVRCIGNSF